MRRHRLDVLDSYELTATPVVSATGLSYVRWIDQAVEPYHATRLPAGPAQGLWAALQRARPEVEPA